MPGSKRILGVIPSRYSSTRLPGKPLADIFGKPMIYWVAKRVAASNLQDYIVATDDERILNVCNQYSIPCVMTSVDCKNGTERVAEVAQKMEYDFYINIQGDEPCIELDSINKLVETVESLSNVEFIQAISLMKNSKEIEDPSFVKVAVTAYNEAIYFSRSVIPYPQDKDQAVYYRCLGLYLYGRDFLAKYVQLPQGALEKAESIEQLRILENGFRIKTVEVVDEGRSIDTPEDLAFIKSEYADCFQNDQFKA